MNETQNSQSPLQSSQKGKINIMAFICYIGFLWLVPILRNDQDEFVKYHAKQGLVIFAGEIITWIVIAIIPILWIFGNLIGILWLVLSIIGILNVARGEKKEVPLIGHFAENFKM